MVFLFLVHLTSTILSSIIKSLRWPNFRPITIYEEKSDFFPIFFVTNDQLAALRIIFDREGRWNRLMPLQQQPLPPMQCD